MSFDFNGTTSLMDYGSPAALDNAEPFTVLAWVAPDSLGEGANGRIFAKESGGTMTSGNWFLTITSSTATNHLFFRKSFAGVGFECRSASNTIRTDGTFQHVALTWDGSATAANAHIYFNGVETTYHSLTNGTGAKSTDAVYKFHVGNRTAADRTFDGRIANFHFFRRVLAVQEIRTLMYHPGGVGSILGLTTSTGGELIFQPYSREVGTVTPDYSGITPEGTAFTSTTVNTQSPPSNEMFVVACPGGMGAC